MKQTKEDKIFHCPNCHEPSELMFYNYYDYTEESVVYVCGNCGQSEFEKNLIEVKEEEKK